MKIVIHAGSLKTGSTYLQAVIWKNRRVLEDSGIFVPQTGVVSRHHYDVARAAGFSYPAQRLADDTAAEILRALVQELSDRQESVALLSSEHFDLGVGQSSVRRIIDALPGYDIRVVIYLRNQVDLIQSLYFEYLKWGGVKDYASFTALALKQGSLAYDDRIEKWVDAGVDICVLDYNVERADLLGSFFSQISDSLNRESLILPDSPVNESLSPEAMEYTRKMNSHLQSPEARRKFYEKIYKKMHAHKSRWTKSRQLPIPAPLAEALPQLSACNRRLAEMLGRDEDFLQGDLATYAAGRTGQENLDMEAFEAALEEYGLPYVRLTEEGA